MINRLLNILKNDNELSDFKINYDETKSGEVFYVFDKIETIRMTNTLTVNVTIYIAHDGALGMKSFLVSSAATDEEIKQKINEAKIVAKTINNEKFDLVENIKSDDKLDFIFENDNLLDVAKKVGSALLDVKTNKNSGINALEVFVSNITKGIINSKGVDRKVHTSSLFVEAIPTFTKDDESVELYESLETKELNFDKLREEIKEKLEEVENRYNAIKPLKELDLDVALRAKELTDLFGELVYDYHYSVIYSHSNILTVGDKLQTEPKYDKINLTLRGKIPGVSESALFDSDGTTLIDTKVIDNGVVSGSFGPKRYADYLKCKANGNLSCLDLEKGNLKMSSYDKPYLEVVSMSGLQFDPYNDYIGGEVRLAYIHEGKDITPITGISISASLKDVLNKVRFSAEEGKTNAYRGPKYALFEGFKIN